MWRWFVRITAGLSMGLWLIFLIGAVALILGGAVYVWLWIGEQH